MGFDEERFVGEVSEERKCSLCRGVLDNPLATPCDHVFCAGCILPWIVQYESCPKKCGQKVLAGSLRTLLTLRHNILNMDVRCDHHARGCREIVSLAELHTHVQEECDCRPVGCRNKGCMDTVHAKDLADHETSVCEYRAVGVCQQGCGLVLLHRDSADHECLVAMKAHVQDQEAKLTCMERDIKKIASKFSKREKSLLAQIASLHSEIQMQALRFQKKLTEYRAQMTNLSRKATQNKLCEESRLTITLSKEQSSLGFNIMGGYNPDSSLSDGIVVSRITENGPADRNGMQIHDQILQVNGQDLSKSTHEEAVEAFRTAREPIVVEVLRRVSKNNKMKSRVPPMVSVSTQTDDFIESPSFYGLYRPPTPPPAFFALNGHGSLCQPSSRQPVAFSPSAELGLTDLEIAYDDSYDDDRTFDLEYEEVILHRLTAEEKVGLTLCYGSADEDMTDIYISEIEPYSIAASDGRIREGDQILQINGVDVHSRDQAIRLFAESKSDICLLLARPHLQMDDGFLDEGNMMLDELQMEMLEKQHHRTMALLAQGQCDEEGGTTDTATTENSCTKHEKDSGVGRTDESTRNDESSEQEIMENDCISPSSQPKFRSGCNLGSGDLHFSNDSFTSNEAPDIDFATNEISAEECDKFREVLENRCSSVDSSPSHHQKGKIPRKDSESSIEREIAILNKEVEDIQMECQSIVEAHMREQQRIRTHVGDPFRSPRMVPRMGTRLDYAKQAIAAQEAGSDIWVRHETPLHARVADLKNLESKHSGSEKDKDTSSTTTSAYNTGDSCRSTPLTLELNQVPDESGKAKQSSMLSLATSQKPSHSDSEKHSQNAAKSSTATKEWNSDGDSQQNNNNVKNGGHEKAELTKSQSSGSVSRMSQTQNDPLCTLERDESLTDLYAQYADVMYTNKANLEHTMMVQQKLFEQQMLYRGGRRQPTGQSLPHEKHGHSRSHPDQSGQTSDQQMEWVVKRRADGSRYITRRPIRNKILKERAKKINEERCGLTTDDDAMSELKVGKYWNKEDRKKHMERAKDQKRKREFMMRQRMETLKEKDGEAENKKELNIVELSHRKMMKHKGKKVFDGFTTVQEMLAHGARVPEGKTYNPLLSVTTV